MAKDAPQLGYDKQPLKLRVERCPTCGGILSDGKHGRTSGGMATDAAPKPEPYVYGEPMKIVR